MFNSIINESEITITTLLISSAASLAAGFVIALSYMYRNRATRSFLATLILLPVIVMAVIMLVNGSIGTGVAVMGAFSLIRFRSAQGTSREIMALFLSMVVGIATGTGQLMFALLITLICCGVMILLSLVRFGSSSNDAMVIRITVPEDLDFEHAFDDIFKKYTSSCELISSKTSDMGSLYDLRYEVIMKPDAGIKQMTDELRVRNGNLTIMFSRKREPQGEQL